MHTLFMANYSKKICRKFIPVNFWLSSQGLLFGPRALIKKVNVFTGGLLFGTGCLFGPQEYAFLVKEKDFTSTF